MTASAELAKLQQRVHDGIIWLVEHDPDSVFHLWFTAGLTPLSPMPAHPDGDVRERWTEYHRARVTFERLDAECARLEGRPTYTGPIEWQPPKAQRQLR